MPTILPANSRTPLQAPPVSGLGHGRSVTAHAPQAKPAVKSWFRSLLPGLGSSRARIAAIQKAMLTELGKVSASPLHEDVLARQVVQAEDAEALWDLRRQLACAIANVHGDLVARQKMTEISFMFAGLLRRRELLHDSHVGENVVRLQPRGQQNSTGA